MRLVLFSLIIAVSLAAGCMQVQEPAQATTTIAEQSSTSMTIQQPGDNPLKTATSSTTTSTKPREKEDNPLFVEAPMPGCECIRWFCPGDPVKSTTITSSTTTTTCVTLYWENYEPQSRHFDFEIVGGRFRPNRVQAFLGDTIVANITSKQGLHTIRETYTERTIVIRPNTSYELIFYALEAGEHLLTCNPFCEVPMEATIEILEPYQTIC